MESIFEHAGGEKKLREFIEIFYRSLLADPLLQPLFGEGNPSHVDNLTAFTVETFGGPDTFSAEMGGFPLLIDAHRGLRIEEGQRLRFVELYMAAADRAELPADDPFRAALRSHVEFGTQVAAQNSHAETDDQLHPLREVPRWGWE